MAVCVTRRLFACPTSKEVLQLCLLPLREPQLILLKKKKKEKKNGIHNTQPI